MKHMRNKGVKGRSARLAQLTGSGGPADMAMTDPLGTPSDLSAGGGASAGYSSGGMIDGVSAPPRMDRKSRGGKSSKSPTVNVIVVNGKGDGGGGPPPPGIMGAGGPPPPMPMPEGPMPGRRSGGRIC